MSVMLLDILFYLGMGTLVLLGVGTVLSIAHVALPAWSATWLAGGWLVVLFGWVIWMILPWVVHLFRP